MKPLAIDLYCGLGGWAEGFLSEGYDVIGFDIERRPYPAQLVLQDVRTIHGSYLRDAAIIVGSSPCQEFSYRAMPFKRCKSLGPPLLGIELFEAQFRIQREASEAAGRHIPMVVENVRGAQPWVGRAAWHYGSYYLWGDAPALMPFTYRAERDGVKVPGMNWSGSNQPGYKAQAFNTTAEQRMRNDGRKVPMNFHEYEKTGKPGRSFQSVAVSERKKVSRKEASAEIAKIPFELACYIASVYKP